MGMKTIKPKGPPITILSPETDGLHPTFGDYDRDIKTAMTKSFTKKTMGQYIDNIDSYNIRIDIMLADMQWGKNRREIHEDENGKYHSTTGPALISDDGFIFVVHGVRYSIHNWLKFVGATNKEKAVMLLKYT